MDVEEILAILSLAFDELVHAEAVREKSASIIVIIIIVQLHLLDTGRDTLIGSLNEPSP